MGSTPLTEFDSIRVAGLERVPASEPEFEEYDPAKDPTPVVAGGGDRELLGSAESRVRKLRVMLSLAMGFAGLGLVGGGAYFTFDRLAPALESRRPRPALSEGMPPEPHSRGDRLDSFPTVYPAPSAPLPLRRGAVPSESEHAPAVTTSRYRATRNRNPGYFEAYADARAEMDEALGYINFQRVFARGHLGSPDSVRVTRRMVQAAANIIRVYRGREVMLEQTYRPDDSGGTGTLREPFETEEATRALLADVDSLFGVLIAQDGQYSLNAASIRIPDAAAAAAYAALRQRIVLALRSWADSADTPALVTMPRLLRALGPAGPPPLSE